MKSEEGWIQNDLSCMWDLKKQKKVATKGWRQHNVRLGVEVLEKGTLAMGIVKLYT